MVILITFLSTKRLKAQFTLERIAELRGLSTRTVDRDWRFARAFLQQALSP